MFKNTVATGSKEATDAAVNILKNGGNAIDAAVSAVFTSMTSEFALTGVGGGGAMMVKIRGEEPTIYDFFVDTPTPNLQVNKEFEKIQINFGESKQYFHIGKASIAIPGTLKGLCHIHKLHGKLPLPVVLESGIHIAKYGCRLNAEQAYIFKLLNSIFLYSNNSKELLTQNNKLIKEGEIFKNVDFANFLERVAHEGDDFFYKGDLSEKIVSYLKDGGLIDLESLKTYKVIKRKPASMNLNGNIIYTNPAPSSGGSLIIFLLKLLKYEKRNAISINKIIKAMAVTDIARRKNCNDTNDSSQFSKLLHNDIIKKYQDLYNNNVINIDDNLTMINRGCTTQVSIMDKNGNCASVTTSNGEGSGYVIPETGIMLNNMLGEEDLNPNGFHKWKSRQRLPTMMSPSIITNCNLPIMVLGSGGSNRIRSAIAQVLINYLYNRKSLEESIESYRVHLEGNDLYYEEGAKVKFDKINMKLNLKPFKNKSLFFGGVNAVTTSEGYSDTRRGGTYEVF